MRTDNVNQGFTEVPLKNILKWESTFWQPLRTYYFKSCQ
jgi:hypothetical protein